MKTKMFPFQKRAVNSKGKYGLSSNHYFQGTCVVGSNLPLFNVIGDGHQPNSRGLYTHYKDSLLKVG